MNSVLCLLQSTDELLRKANDNLQKLKSMEMLENVEKLKKVVLKSI